MRVQEGKLDKDPSLVLIPETLHEKDMLKRCLGSRSPLMIVGVLREFNTPDLKDYVVLWNSVGDSKNESDPVQGVTVVRKRADLGAFMNALRRYINNIVDHRLYGAKGPGDDEHLLNRVHEASQSLQEVIRPLFEEEIPG